jgi:hypothetical protein
MCVCVCVCVCAPHNKPKRGGSNKAAKRSARSAWNCLPEVLLQRTPPYSLMELMNKGARGGRAEGAAPIQVPDVDGNVCLGANL